MENIKKSKKKIKFKRFGVHLSKVNLTFVNFIVTVRGKELTEEERLAMEEH